LARSPNPSRFHHLLLCCLFVPFALTVLFFFFKSPKADHVALQKYRDRFLNRNNAVVVGVGVEHELFVAEAEAAFAGLPSGSAASNSSKTVYVGGESHVESDGEPLFVLAFESGGLSSRDFLVASVLQEVLGRTPDRLFNKPRPGDGLSSRLNRALGPEAAVVFAESFVSSYSDAGLFGVQVQALSGHENTVLSAVSEELAKLAKSPLAEAELNGAKLRLKHSILKGSEQVDMRAHFFARQALYSDKVLCRSDYVSRIDSINAGEVQQFVAKILKGKRTLVSEGNSANYKN
jgi:predicted Zn-dependent peptidase